MTISDFLEWADEWVPGPFYWVLFGILVLGTFVVLILLWVVLPPAKFRNLGVTVTALPHANGT